MGNIEEQNGAWLFVTPISNLILTKAVNFEIKLNRVTFIDASKLASRRKRLGFPLTIGSLKKQTPEIYCDFFSENKTYAVLRQSGKGTEVREKLLKIIRDELALLALSQLGYSRRSNNACPSIAEEGYEGRTNYLILHTENLSCLQNSKLTGKFLSLTLEQTWRNYQKKSFYNKLLKIIRGDIPVAKKWKKDLTNASILVGQSQCSTDLPQAFLWNMIALEMLLTEQGDTYSESLPERAEAFIGWASNWEDEDYHKKIREIYSKRCMFVHDGNRDSITEEDVAFSDEIIYNILLNIVNNPKLFGSKKSLIIFSNKVQAQRTLGVGSIKSLLGKGNLFFSRFSTKKIKRGK